MHETTDYRGNGLGMGKRRGTWPTIVLALGLACVIGLRVAAQTPVPQTPPATPPPPAERPAEPPAHGGPEVAPAPRPRSGGQDAPRFPAHQRPPADPAVLERGRAQYAGLCSACHGVDARGGQLGG